MSSERENPTVGQSSIPLNPGDEVAPGTPGTGEALYRVCGGSGRIVQNIGDA